VDHELRQQQSRQGPALYGREAELTLLSGLLDDAAGRGHTLLFTGDPGVGKSMLLQAVEHLADDRGLRVLKATGSQFEASISFAGLHQLLFPLLGEINKLPGWQRQALEAGLGIARGSGGSELAVYHAALELLVRAADVAPLVLLIDDVPWLDHASAAALGFVARRVSGHRIVCLAAARTGEASYFERAGLETLEVQPLNMAAAAALVASRYPALTARVRQRLVREAEGNPLALLELPAALKTHPTPVGAQGVLPLGRKLERVFGERVDVLPEETREVLLVAVLDGTGELATVERIAAQWGDLDALAPAIRAGLVTIDPGGHRLMFRHPLIRSAVVEKSTSTQRRRVHRLLAYHRQDNFERHAWHLAEATEGPDEAVAWLLQQVGHANLRRGDSVGAISELLRSADLSPSGVDKANRLTEAAYLGATVTGDMDEVSGLLDAARRAHPDTQSTLSGAVAGAYHLLNGHGDVTRAHALLVGAIRACRDPSDAHDQQLVESIYTLLSICFFSNSSVMWRAAGQVLAGLKPRPPRLLAATAALLGNPVYEAADGLPLLEELVRGLDRDTSPARITRVGIAAAYVDRLPDCREALWRAVQHGREGGAVTSAIEGLLLLANAAYFSGEWDDVDALTAEGLSLCGEHGYVLYEHPAMFLRGLVHAARGERAAALELADTLDEWARPRQIDAVRAYAIHIRATLHMGFGDYDAAFEALRGFTADATLVSHVPHVLWLLMDLVESAVRAGQPEVAGSLTESFDVLGLPEVSSRLALVTAACRGITAPDDDFARHFDTALGADTAGRWPVDLARTQLAYGERLRRLRATREARVQLAAAHETFRRLGATPWTARAEHELRAAGHPVQERTVGQAPAELLTPQQLEIAQLAASGLTNKEIGERLFLSHRTIGTHLYAIFPKLGITSRAALSDALRHLESDA
jgi:DNA-binding CsgD family transcriptional regulator